MAPKKRASSPGPKAKGKAKAKEDAKPKEEVAEDPKALLKKEAEEMFDKYEDGGIIKLSGFADCIRAVNIRKVHVFGDEPGPIIKEQWKSCGGFSKKEIDKPGFVLWWPDFMEFVEAEAAKVAEANEKIQADKAAKEKEKSEKYEKEGIWYINLDELKVALDQAFKKNKTPLIIDNTEGQRSEAFFMYSGGFILECKKMIMDKAKGKTLEDVLDEELNRFWSGNCFKYGQTVVFRLSNCAIDIKNQFNTEAMPLRSLLDTAEVKKIMGPDNADNFKGSPFSKMCRTDDEKFECETMGINESFRVVAITHFEEADYVGFLENQFPLELCQPIKISVT